MIISSSTSNFRFGLQSAISDFNKNEIDIISLCNYDTFFHKALEKRLITSNDFETLKDWKIKMAYLT